MDYHKSLADISSSFSETDCANGHIYDEEKKLHEERVRIQMALKKLSEESEKLAAERRQLEVSIIKSPKRLTKNISVRKTTVAVWECYDLIHCNHCSILTTCLVWIIK